MAFLTRTTTRAYRGVVASEAAMLALTATVSDWITRSDLAGQIFELTALPASAIANWESYPVGAGVGSGGDVSLDPLWDAVGDLAVGTGVNSATRLPMGVANQVLAVNTGGTGLQWSTPASAGSMQTDTLWDAAGDLAVGTGSNTGTRLPIGTTLQTLRVNSGGTGVEWAAPAASGITVKDESSTLATACTTMTFTGTGVTATGTGAEKTIEIPGASSFVQSGLTPASSVKAPDIDTVVAALYPTPRSETASFSLTNTNNANRDTFYSSASPGNATFASGHGMTIGASGVVTQTGAGAVTAVQGSGATLVYAPIVGVSAATTADGDWWSWLQTGANEFTITDCGKVGATGGNIAADVIWDAKGDLAVGTGANTAAKLTATTNAYVLTLDSAEATGMKWAAAGGIQVIDLPIQAAKTSNSTVETFCTCTVPGNSFTNGKLMRVNFLLKLKTSDPITNFEIVYGSQIIYNTTIGSSSNEFTHVSMDLQSFAQSNSAQATPVLKTSSAVYTNTGLGAVNATTVDATASQTLLIRGTTPATGTVSITCQGRVEIL